MTTLLLAMCNDHASAPCSAFRSRYVLWPSFAPISFLQTPQVKQPDERARKTLLRRGQPPKHILGTCPISVRRLIALAVAEAAGHAKYNDSQQASENSNLELALSHVVAAQQLITTDLDIIPF